MKLNNVRMAMLALVASLFAVPSAAVAEGWFGDMDDVKDVTLGEVLQKPRPYLDVPIRIKLYFDRKGRSYNPFYTRFSEELYHNFSAWPIDARLYERRDFKRSFPHFFVSVLDKSWEKLSELDQITPIEVTGYVRDVFRGQPWIEVVDWDTVRDGMDADEVRAVVAGDANFLAGRYEEARKLYKKATSNRYPPVVRAEVYRRLADAEFHLGDYDDALDYYRDALESVPESEVLQRNIQVCNEMIDREDHPKKYAKGDAGPGGPEPFYKPVVNPDENDVDAIIRQFEDPAMVAAEVAKHRLELDRRLGRAPSEDVVPVNGTKEPEAEKPAVEPTVVEPGQPAAEPVVEEPAAEEPAAKEPEQPAEAPEQPAAEESQPEEVEVAPTPESEVTDGVDESAGEDWDPEPEGEAAADAGESPEGEACSDGCAADQGEGVEVDEESGAEEGGEEQPAAEESADQGESEGEDAAEAGCSEEAAPETAEQPEVEQPAAEEPAAEQPEVEQPAAEAPAAEVEEPAVEEQPAAEQPEVAEEPAAEDAPVAEGEGEGEEVVSDDAPAGEPTEVVEDEAAPVEVPVVETPVIEAPMNQPLDQPNRPLVDAETRTVLVSGTLVRAPRLPFFGCEEVTLAQIREVLEEIAQVGIE